MSVKGLSCNGGVLSLDFDDGTSFKCVLPKGERGPAGRDGISIRGDKGEQGVAGPAGRDSVVPGPKGDKGDAGPCGPSGVTPRLCIGRVEHGDEPKVYLSGPPEAPTLDFVLPRGPPGLVGRPGADGKHGSHEFISVCSVGHAPAFCDEWLGRHIIADGIIDLPSSMSEDAVGRWFSIKTFDRVVLNNCVEGQVSIQKNESAKLVIVPYGDSFKFTRF